MDAVCEVSKNSCETIRFQISEFKGKEYGDIRVYYRDSVTDELKPTKKGLTISPALWPEFVKGIKKLGEEMRERGLLTEAGDED